MPHIISSSKFILCNSLRAKKRKKHWLKLTFIIRQKRSLLLPCLNHITNTWVLCRRKVDFGYTQCTSNLALPVTDRLTCWLVESLLVQQTRLMSMLHFNFLNACIWHFPQARAHSVMLYFKVCGSFLGLSLNSIKSKSMTSNLRYFPLQLGLVLCGFLTSNGRKLINCDFAQTVKFFPKTSLVGVCWYYNGSLWQVDPHLCIA